MKCIFDKQINIEVNWIQLIQFYWVYVTRHAYSAEIKKFADLEYL